MKTARLKALFAAAAMAAALFAPPLARTASSEVVDRIVAVINDSIITLSELNAATALAVDKLGGGMDKDRIVELKSRILDTLIEQKLVKQASDRAGIEVSEREIDNAIDDVKRQNSMSHEQLMLALAQSGLTYREYREQLKEQIRQVKFINKEFRSKISVQPEDIEDYYRSHVDEFSGPERVRLAAVFISSRDEARMKKRLASALDALKGGADFASVAMKYSDGPTASSGGDLGYLDPEEVSGELKSAASALSPGEVSPPVAASGGVYIIKLTERKAPEPKPLDEVRAQIHERLFNRIMDQRFTFWLSEVKKYAHLEVRL